MNCSFLYIHIDFNLESQTLSLPPVADSRVLCNTSTTTEAHRDTVEVMVEVKKRLKNVMMKEKHK